MKKKFLKIYNLLPGVGKTFSIVEDVKKLNSNEILFLSFNKDIKEKMINNNGVFNKKNTFTLHSFCYDVLKKLGKLPSEFINNEPLIENYDVLITEYLKLTNKEKKLSIGENTSTVICDEYQDFSVLYVKLLKNIVKTLNYPNLIIAGDETQIIYSFLNLKVKNNKKILNNFQNIRNDFPKYIDNIEEINLNKNHRITSNTNLLFLNEFYRRNFNLDKNKLYETLEYNENDVKPELRFFTNYKEEYHYVNKQAESYRKNGYSVLIISRYKKAIEMYNEIYKNPELNGTFEDKLITSTVHKQKGLQADVVFLINYNCNELKNKEELNVLNVAITRMKYKLIITSSQPNIENLIKPLPIEYMDYENLQTNINKPKMNLLHNKKIIKNRNFTKKKLENNVIDKLVFEISLNDVPFYKYINKTQIAHYENKDIVKLGDFNYTIRFNHKANKYYFEFYDLKILHKNNFNDQQIIHYIYNLILEYFDYRVDASKIYLYNIDLQKHFFFNDKISYLESKYKEVKKYYENKSFKTKNYTNNKNTCNSLTSNTLYNNQTFEKNNEDTFYFNTRKNYKSALLITIYNPNKKDNNNIVNIKNFYKVEYRLKSSTFKLRTFKQKYGILTLEELVSKKSSYYLEMFDFIDEYLKK